jgi:HEAT repeat protein
MLSVSLHSSEGRPMSELSPLAKVHKAPTLIAHSIRSVVLLLPVIILLVGGWRAPGQMRMSLFFGAAFQFLICILALVSERSLRQSFSTTVIAIYLIALGWLWLGAGHLDDWYQHLSQAILLIVPLVLFSLQTLLGSGALAVRRAQALAHRLASRKEWPENLAACRDLPEVKALREALHQDATPALNLLRHPELPVRVAALAALEFRKNWRPGQAEIVLKVAQNASEPSVRAAALMVLANVDDRILVEMLAGFLRDPAREVRRAAADALFWDSERRWPWIRLFVRTALADPDLESDGPLRNDGQLLSAEALADLNGWAAEKGLVAQRAAQTLGAHYSRLLHEQESPGLLEELEKQLANPHAPAALRLELAHLLKSSGKWEKEMLEQLLDPKNPAPLRLMAADTLLADTGHNQARAALYEIARLPNRELALATAEVVQRRLSVDLGLAMGQPGPPIHSRQAAEVTRRVMLWAEEARVLGVS